LVRCWRGGSARAIDRWNGCTMYCTRSYNNVRRDIKHSRLFQSCIADLFVVKVRQHFEILHRDVIPLHSMLRQVVRQSLETATTHTRVEQELRAVQSTSCDHTCSREEDLERHHGKIHPDIVFATATGSGATEEALQPTLRSHEHCGITPGLNPETLLDTKDHSDDIERTDQHESPESAAAVTKRKSSELGGLSPDHKRVCIESNLIDLDTLSLVDDSDARVTFTPNTTKNKDQHAITTWTSGLTAPSALGSSDISALLRSTLLSDVGAPRSMSISGSGIGSLFGRPSTHAYEPWKT
jgi:hypothetical protein